MSFPDFSFERKCWRKGFKVVAGADEVGRGSFAGPVVAGCVAFAPGSKFDELSSRKIFINDSKKVTPKRRKTASYWIKKHALTYGIGWATVGEINRLGIKKASEIAFRRAIKNCGKKIDYLLIDAFYVPHTKGLRRKNQKPIIKGDSKSFSIASASIIAKVYRDNLMTKLSDEPKYKKYKWDENKGYGTSSHRKAIRQFGITRLHRKKFVETYIKNSFFSPTQ